MLFRSRNQPDNPAGYFLGMCVKRLRELLPAVSPPVLRAALNGRSNEYQLVTEMLLSAAEAK